MHELMRKTAFCACATQQQKHMFKHISVR